jgi:threonine synthase
MDIQISSNFERLLFDAYGGDASAVRAQMGALKQAGEFSLAPSALAAIRRDFDAERVDEKACADEMARVYRDSGVVVDPHSAVGVHAARAALERDPETPVIALATAHPAKFPEAVERAIGRRPELPPHLAEIQSRRERCAILPNDPSAVAKFVRERARVAA